MAFARTSVGANGDGLNSPGRGDFQQEFLDLKRRDRMRLFNLFYNDESI